MNYIGIEIGGTKVQVGVGPGDGTLPGLWRGTVDPARGGEGIREQIVRVVPELLRSAGLDRSAIRGAGVGFGGPVDDDRRAVIKSHQITGWDGFPLADWLGDALSIPIRLGNDADCAGLAEATFGAGRGQSPVFYMTIGSGIGGGLILDGEIARGTGRGAAEIGHLKVRDPHRRDGSMVTLEAAASGWAIGREARGVAETEQTGGAMLRDIAGSAVDVTAQTVAQAAQQGDPAALRILDGALNALAEAINAVIVLICPRVVIIGGGVSLMGDDLIFDPLRDRIRRGVFPPFAGLTEIVPASLGEEVVVHGALALARLSDRRRGGG